jgi:DNA ligase 1
MASSVSRRAFLAGLAAAGAPAHAAGPAPLMLAHSWRGGIDLREWAVSEKYDGVRGYWDGRRLATRGGEPIAAPAWFTERLPPVPLDGELWAGRGQFAAAVSTVRTQTPDDAAWKRLRYMVFDLPSHQGTYAERSASLAGMIPALGRDFILAVTSSRVGHEAELRALLQRTVQAGGEGLMLHRLGGRYRAARSRDLLKVKTGDDADAIVVAHEAGKGKHEGAMGALWVETPEGIRFKIGTGFPDALRRNPPPVGSWISFRFRGETKAGVPRFASFLRVRADLKPL